MKNILFSINTEFHVLVITSLIEQYYSDDKKYDVTVLIQINNDGNRFKESLNFDFLKANVVMLNIENKGKKYHPRIKTELENILSKEYEKFIFFLEQTPINQYLAYRLSSLDTIICVAPEGTKPYITISKAALPSRLKATFYNYKFFLTQKLKVNRLNIVSNKNGYLKDTNEVWITYPEMYKNRTKKKIVQIDLFTTIEQIQIASKIFNFNVKKGLPETDNIIFYLNQWYTEFKVYDYEIDMLEAVLQKHLDKKIYIKLHPNTHKFQVEKLESMDRIVLNRSTIPAEIFILNLTNSIVFSFWSASLLINNNSCKFYWLNKMPVITKLMGWWSIINPTDHINEIENLDLLKF